MTQQVISHYLDSALSFADEAHRILGKHESTRSRVVTLDKTRTQLAEFSLVQDGLFREALKCVECGAYAAAHVMAWAAYMDGVEHKLASDGLQRLHLIRPKWDHLSSLEELRENIPEYQFIDVARDLRLLGKAEAKTLHGLLSKRNECAHPSHYSPDLNETLGYISELMKRAAAVVSKRL